MRRRAWRFWRVVKWGGTGACGLTAVAWLLSPWVSYKWASPDQRTFLSFDSGRVTVVRFDRSPAFPRASTARGFTIWEVSQLTRERFGLVLPSRPGRGSRVGIWVVPVWIALLALLVPTTIAWIKCRRYPPGGCQRCGYNLTGNVSGTCPECGTAVNADAVAKDATEQD